MYKFFDTFFLEHSIFAINNDELVSVIMFIWKIILTHISFSDDRKDGRTDFPRPEMDVSCLSDGVQVVIHLQDQDFDGVLYVKGRSKDEQCRRVVSIPAETEHKTETFKVAFGNCGLIHVNVS